jgi:hypothetical protein
MFTLSHTMPINNTEPQLTRPQIWQGLVLKAENPVPFLKSMSACTVIERGDNWLLRDFTLRGEDMQERVTFEPEERVTFVRTESSAMGSVVNEIVELDDGALGERRFFGAAFFEAVDMSTASKKAAPKNPRSPSACRKATSRVSAPRSQRSAARSLRASWTPPKAPPQCVATGDRQRHFG